MKHLSITLTITALILAAAPLTHATIIQYSANLADETNTSPGTGIAVITIDDVLNTMRVEASFADLLAPTTAAHIHCCTTIPESGNAGVATTTPSFPGFTIGVTSGTYDNTFDMLMAASYNPSFITANGGTAASAKAALFNGLFLNEAYFNIHTSALPAGEIRGYLSQVTEQVPEPSTLALLSLSLLGLGFSRKKPDA